MKIGFASSTEVQRETAAPRRISSGRRFSKNLLFSNASR
jgi:hypothetical protein